MWISEKTGGSALRSTEIKVSTKMKMKNIIIWALKEGFIEIYQYILCAMHTIIKKRWILTLAFLLWIPHQKNIAGSL